MHSPKSYSVDDPSGELAGEGTANAHFRFLSPGVDVGITGEVWRSESTATAHRTLNTTLASGLHIACGAGRAESKARGGGRFSAAGTTFALSYLEGQEVFETQVEPGDVRCVGVYLPDARIDDETGRIVDRIRALDTTLMQQISPFLIEVANRLLAPLPTDYGEAACRLVMEARGLEIIAAAHSMLLEPESETPIAHRHRRIARDASAYIDENLARKITIPELARAVAASPRTLTDAFRTNHGETIAAYVTRRRMEHATNLLRDGHTVSATASAINYSPNAFSHAFRHYAGVRPRDLRNP